VCRNCGLPVAADDDPLRGVSPGNVEMPSAQRAGVSATIGLGIVVVLLLVAGTLAVSGGGILSGGGRIGVAADASPSPSADTGDGTEPDGGSTGTGTVGTPGQEGGTETDFSCTTAGILDPEKGKWSLAGPSPSTQDDFDRLTFRLNKRGKGKASDATVVRFEFIPVREARETYDLRRVGGTRALVVTFEGPVSIDRNSFIELSELEAAGNESLRSVDIIGGDDGDVRAVIGVRGEGCAALSAPKWKKKGADKQARVYLDVKPA